MPTIGHVAARTWRRIACVSWAFVFMLAPAIAFAQSGVIIGRVTDARLGEPLPGAAVEIEGTRLVSVTDAEGRYRIADVPAGARFILVRHIGFGLVRHAGTVPASGQVTADIPLETSAIALDEIVVTGAAGGARLRTIGNAVSTIAATRCRRSRP